MTDIEWSQDQQEAIDEIKDWYFDNQEQVLTFGGLAGTGKTTMIAALPDELGTDVIYCAPTGKAATVLSRKLPYGSAKTIHQLIYHARQRHCAKCPVTLRTGKPCHGNGRSTCGCEVEYLKSNKKSDALIVVDESSMVSERLYEDLLDFAGERQVLFVGDHGQLPPVKSDFNLMDAPNIRLETIHRQAADSPIIQLAMLARTTGEIPFGDFSTADSRVRKIVAGEDIDLDIDGDTLMVCGTNNLRIWANKLIREQLGFRGRPKPGEPVICLRNNWRVGIFNGLTGTVKELLSHPGNSRIYDAVIDLGDGSDYVGTISAEQFLKESTYQDRGKGVDLFDFGYCLTVHKSQGSQAQSVIFIEDRGSWDEDTWRRLLYTAVTRAERNLLVMKYD